MEQQTSGEHCLNIFVSEGLKDQLQQHAHKSKRTTADMVREILTLYLLTPDERIEALEADRAYWKGESDLRQKIIELANPILDKTKAVTQQRDDLVELAKAFVECMESSDEWLTDTELGLLERTKVFIAKCKEGK